MANQESVTSKIQFWCEGAGEWRGERELAEHMINVLERK